MEYEIGDDESVSVAVVRAVSAVVGRKPSSLQPLEAVLDTDALDTLFGPRPDGTTRTGGSVSFVYNDCRVRMDNAEHLSIEPIEVTLRGTES